MPPRLDTPALTDAQRELRRAAHHALAKAADDIGRRRNFNTAIAASMELLNTIGRFDDLSDQGRAVRHEALEFITLMLSPIVPHVATSCGGRSGTSARRSMSRGPRSTNRR